MPQIGRPLSHRHAREEQARWGWPQPRPPPELKYLVSRALALRGGLTVWLTVYPRYCAKGGREQGKEAR